MSFQGHSRLLESDNFTLKNVQIFEVCEPLLCSSLIAANSAKNLEKYPKEGLKKSSSVQFHIFKFHYIQLVQINYILQLNN